MFLDHIVGKMAVTVTPAPKSLRPQNPKGTLGGPSQKYVFFKIFSLEPPLLDAIISDASFSVHL